MTALLLRARFAFLLLMLLLCVCGYQLYQLTGTTCPECGREIPEGDRWAVHAEKTTAPGIVFD